MKVASFAALFLAHSSSVAASQIRGSLDGISDENKYSAEARKLAADAQAFHRELEQEFNPYDNGAGCSCSKDAVKEIAHKHVDAMEKVPYVTLALLEENKDILWQGNTDYNPLENYEEVSEAVEALVNYARCVLLQIDCNQCGVDGKREEDRRQLETITPYPGISNLDCCCDVNAIKKIVIDRIHDFYKKALLNPGGDKFVRISAESLFITAIEAIDATADKYLSYYNPYECTRPDISLSF